MLTSALLPLLLERAIFKGNTVRFDIKLAVPTKWKTMVALLLAIIALKFNLFVIWGVFCCFWGIENLRNKEAYFVERVKLSDNPILFTIIILSWFFMGALYFYMDDRIFQFFYAL
ncbi:hypothetical protein OPW32_21730 [Vibrio europaeus]|uniref:hypothetical protein n=1 Tax=Vibrio europaeus TaxID=300876 RepID=UPI0023402CF6|nr:hypothetical protein [Vibrio europaeus]MDC5851813.1 hypothetical protein [Vibrio europaeus]